MSAEAMSRWRRICLNEGRFLGLQFLWTVQTNILSVMQLTLKKMIPPLLLMCFLLFPVLDHFNSLHLLKVFNFIMSSYCWCLNFLYPYHSSPLSPPACSPALPQEQFETVGAAIRYRQLQTVVAHSPDDSRGIHILIGHFSCQHLPQHDAKWPADR